MRALIIAVRWQSIAAVFSVIYCLAGVTFYIVALFQHPPEILAPFGILFTFVYLTVNIHFQQSTSLGPTLTSGIVVVIAYTISGWITGAVFALLFNAVAALKGGISAKFIRKSEEE
ncbi:MAG TPA: hypothetical protein VFU55_01655 [Terracidiphilus sp.]|nr:hypothetical protein [Terracidiphilus sp.]